MIVGLLWSCERFRWFGIGRLKGWPVLIAASVIGLWAAVAIGASAAAPLFRRRCRFSLRVFLFFIAAISIVCSWFAVELSQARRQAAAILAVTKCNGYTQYSWEVDEDGTGLVDPERPAPSWLTNWLGPDFFGGVDCVSLSDTNATADALAGLNDLFGLRRILLRRSDNPNAVLEHVKGLTDLRELDLSDSRLTVATLKLLDGLANLEKLDLTRTNVTDGELAYLGRSRSITDLSLGQTHISDRGLIFLKDYR